MNQTFDNEFKKSLETGFLDHSIESDRIYRPQLLVNKKIPKEKVLSTILNELESCQEFFISVAFVTSSGVMTLYNSLIRLEEKGVKGKILVSQYLNFTQPEALKKLLNFGNIELRISTKSNSHSKGYLFKTNEYYNIIVGSSNLTASALSTNKEWNLKVSGLYESEIVKDTLAEFGRDFDCAIDVTPEYIANYEKVYDYERITGPYKSPTPLMFDDLVKPNSMQIEALENLRKLRLKNKNKALIISATGTGKTFLSAFDVRATKSKKLLFVVHRLNIAQAALATFEKVFKNEKLYGIYSGGKREINADFIFSTIQTISKDDHLTCFSKKEFDYIIIDESHRSGAESYRRLIEYFEPQFLLGMTATPERTDGNDIFSLFDHNVAYEIRLNRAMEEDMLSEFHYFGITDFVVNNESSINIADFKFLMDDERVNRIVEKAEFYGCDNGIIRGLIFCSRNEEAAFLSHELNLKGLQTVALSGSSSEEARRRAIALLESDDLNEKLDYVITVDVFNEGIDIPKINQIIMLRPTDSAIVFVQQLGRGLRKVKGKDFLTVIDFIGNHRNNYLIPIALYGDTSYNKDSLRKLLSEGSKLLPGSSTINFDEISKERIFESIDTARLSLFSDLKKDYELLKYRLGRIPKMLDYLIFEQRDPYAFAKYSKSYYNFVERMETDLKGKLTQHMKSLLQLFSTEINNGKRVEESLILFTLMQERQLDVFDLKRVVYDKYGFELTPETIESCLRNLNFVFANKPEDVVILESNMIKLHPSFSELFENDLFYQFLFDSLQYSIRSFDKKFDLAKYREGFILYEKYGRKDVCRLLNWDKDYSSTVYGYSTKQDVTPCFVTYNKSDDINASTNYNDHFITPSVFAWESRSNRKVSSPEIQNVMASKRILLFVKKEDGEGSDFYFMGNVSIIPDSVKQARMPRTKLPVVHFKFLLNDPVKPNLYNYLTTIRNKEDIEAPIKSQTFNEHLESGMEKPRHIIPLYNFYAAAGSFSDMQSSKDYEDFEVEEKYAKEGYFACRVIGESMNRRIPNGSLCIFKRDEGGSRNGKIVLVENHDTQDPEFDSAFTVKTYSSRKTLSMNSWRHNEIVLKPNSYDKKYTDIVVDEDMANGMKVVGEFVCIVQD